MRLDHPRLWIMLHQAVILLAVACVCFVGRISTSSGLNNIGRGLWIVGILNVLFVQISKCRWKYEQDMQHLTGMHLFMCIFKDQDFELLCSSDKR